MPKKKLALISGITGQDGGYLAKLLLEKNYRVIGLKRRSATDSMSNLKDLGILDKIEFQDFELLEQSNICNVIKNYKPDEFYNLAAQSFVGVSWNEPVYTVQANAMGVMYILEAIKEFSPKTKFYQASTSEMFGMVQERIQDEKTPFYPRSPYGVAKLAAHYMVINYRESFGLHASSGILFNHESPMRGKEFVTRKITAHFAKLYTGQTDKPLELGNMDSKRDWGFAGDYVKAMWLMLQQKKPDTYVVATGKTYSVRDFVEETAKICGYFITWKGKGLNETGTDKKTGKVLVKINKAYYRPAEVDFLLGNPAKAQKQLKWKNTVNFKQLCKLMVEKDIERAKKGIL